MAIEKNCFKVSRVDSEFSARSRESMSSDEEEFPRAGESDEDDEFNDCDSGAGSDDFDLLELGESGEEFCQIWDQTCSIPLELYDLRGLEDVLSMDTWNDCLTEEDRFSLTRYLPDMDHDMFMRTLKQLFTGCNFHFGSPINKLFGMLKGGLCEPRVALYRQGSHFFQKRKHYHFLRKHQNLMVTNLYQIRDTWTNCRGYSIEEKLRVLNIVKSQKSIMHEKMEELESDSSEREEPADGVLSKGLTERQLGQRVSGYRGSPNLDFDSRASQVSLEPMKHGKQNPKGTLKLAGSKIKKELAGRFPPAQHSSPLGFDSGGADEDEGMYEVSVQKDKSYLRSSALDNDFKAGRKYEVLRGEEYSGSLMGLPVSRKDLHAFGRNNRTVNQLSDIKVLTAKPVTDRMPRDYGKKLKFPNVQQFEDDEQIKYGNEQFWHSKVQGEPFSVDPSLNYSDWNARSKKWKLGRKSPDFRDGFLSEYRLKPSMDKARSISMQNGVKGVRMFTECEEETESDSSEQGEDDEIGNPLMRSKWAYPSGASDMKTSLGPKKSKLVKKDKKNPVYIGDGDSYSSKAKQKGKMPEIGFEDGYAPGTGWFNDGDDQDDIYKTGRNGQLLGRKQKGEMGRSYVIPNPTYLPDYIVDQQEQSVGAVQLGRSNGVKKSQVIEQYDDYSAKLDAQLRGCNSTAKKRKVRDDVRHMNERDDNDYQHSLSQPQFDDVITSKRKGKRKLEEDGGNFEKVASETAVIEPAIEEIEVEIKPQKKPFTLITPTVHTGFSFSVVHLLTAVRMAMVTLLPEDNPLDAGKQKIDGTNGDLDVNNLTDQSGQPSVPSLTVVEIVNRVRSNPRDPCILETQEPLQDLVRGVLKIFSSKTAPLGAKGWKALVLYEKSTKSWSWVGPVTQNSLLDPEAVEEVNSPEAWGLPHKMLVKLVDSFANWLKSGQETLQQIGSLPAPPLTLMQANWDEKERFRDLRAQKSLSTITPSSDEVREYFRKEEVLRYSIPDRAFSYTAVDGKKSIVAPLRRCGGKPTAKARDHWMLKRERPPHVTILCLVRDAASRLPGSIGTRADVCTLIRDSQYVVEEVTDHQVNQVVSGALDRLHYERDPCVQFDGERKLWVYLHREREEEDFEDDGTSSTKKWKRQKKEPAEPSDQGALVTVAAYHNEQQLQTGINLSSDLNAELMCGPDEEKRVDVVTDLVVYSDDRNNMEPTVGFELGEMNQDPPKVLDPSMLNSTQERKRLLCLENSTNEDFDDDNEAASDGEPPH